MDPIVTVLVSAGGTPVMAGLMWLLWRERRERTRDRLLTALAARMSIDGSLEDTRPDGSRLVLTRGSTSEGRNG
jgi:hypothetical protein